MRTSYCRPLAVAAAALLAGTAAAAARNFISEGDRAAPGERAVHVVIAQAEIGTEIVPSRVTTATGGGLLFALVDAGIDSARAKKAEAAVQPIRAALVTYDFDGKVLEMTDSAMSRIAWFRPLPAALTKDSSKEAKLAALDAAPGQHVAFLDIRYGANPDFSAIVVTADFRIAGKATPAGQQSDQRLRERNLVYGQTLHSVVMLADPAKETETNAATWAAGDARLARAALDLAIDRMRDLIDFGVNRSEETASAMRKGKKVKIGEYAGHFLESNAHGTALYDRPDIVFIQTLSP